MNPIALSCFYSDVFFRKSQLLLVGTADGQLSIYDASEFQSELHVCPTKLHLGVGRMPVRGFVPAMTITNDVVLWGSCGTSLFSLRGDLQVHSVIETSKTQRTINDDESVISCLCADKYVYLARHNNCTVEIWDGANSRYHGAIDCSYAIWYVVCKTNGMYCTWHQAKNDPPSCALNLYFHLCKNVKELIVCNIVFKPYVWTCLFPESCYRWVSRRLLSFFGEQRNLVNNKCMGTENGDGTIVNLFPICTGHLMVMRMKSASVLK
uniref:LRRK2 beta-propeller domain-containing protein n=1 Tax=Eptatretus burgeri TaxID=7764 RepID=A0A8C4R9B3_EPTBU